MLYTNMADSVVQSGPLKHHVDLIGSLSPEVNTRSGPWASLCQMFFMLLVALQVSLSL